MAPFYSLPPITCTTSRATLHPHGHCVHLTKLLFVQFHRLGKSWIELLKGHCMAYRSNQCLIQW